jgi:TolB-like protein/Flp pilus assembly protein TadD
MVLPRFLTELKRRKVYRVALVYSAVGWVLLEAADVVLPRLGLPDWTVNLVLAIVLLGFPLALVFAWIFDLGPQGVVRTEPFAPEAHHHSFSISSVVEFVLICILVATVGYLYLDRLSLQERLVETGSAVQEKPEAGQTAVPNTEQYRAIAVLPFADMSEAGDQSWFAEGIAEELLIALSQVDALNVVARTSAFAFKGTDKTVAEIADILGVQAVLEGSVRRSGDRVRISAQLVDARSGYHIWSGSYERQLTDIFALQDELARGIVQALRVELGVGPTVPLVAEQTKSVEAYSWFMRGRALGSQGNLENIDLGISYLEKAVELDPDYAMAWGYLALQHGGSMAFKSFDEAGPATVAAYERALALDPEQSEALATKAVLTQLLEHDWEKAGQLYQRAMASTENTMAVFTYSTFYLLPLDRIRQAIRLQTDVEKRDPLHAAFKSNHAFMLLISGDAEAAARKAREALELNPRNLLALANLIQAYTDMADFSAVQRLLEQIPPALQERPRIKAQIGLYYAAQGDVKKARQYYQEVRELLDKLPPNGLYFIIPLALSLGEVEESIDLLERAVDERLWTQFWSKSAFIRNNEAVWDHPRYQALLKRIGLDDESVATLNRQLSFD